MSLMTATGTTFFMPRRMRASSRRSFTTLPSTPFVANSFVHVMSRALQRFVCSEGKEKVCPSRYLVSWSPSIASSMISARKSNISSAVASAQT